METELKNKVVLVTGGAGGIGSEICHAFFKEGARVAVHYRTSQSQADKIVANYADAGIAVKANLTDENEVDEMFDEVENHWGSVEILIANAGAWPKNFAPIHQMTLSQWQSTITTNLTSMFLSFKRFFQGIQKYGLTHPSGILIGSTAGLIGEAGHSDYAASKSGASVGLLLTLKNEIVHLAPQGRVNAICPGWTETEMIGKFASNTDLIKKTLQTIPLKKIGSPSDVAKAAIFLSSHALSGHMTGQSLVLSGGMEGRVLFEKDEIHLGSGRMG